MSVETIDPPAIFDPVRGRTFFGMLFPYRPGILTGEVSKIGFKQIYFPSLFSGSVLPSSRNVPYAPYNYPFYNSTNDSQLRCYKVQRTALFVALMPIYTQKVQRTGLFFLFQQGKSVYIQLTLLSFYWNKS
jgi:hypothetical protein